MSAPASRKPSNVSSTESAPPPPQFFPESVEEAGFMLSAAVLQCTSTSATASSEHAIRPPPAGMHSSFGACRAVPSQELVDRLYALRALLRSYQQDQAGLKKPQPLVAAPSLLDVLMKLIGASTSLAAAGSVGSSASSIGSSLTSGSSTHPTSDNVIRVMETPPLLSTPIRALWVDCVVLCHTLGQGLKGPASQRISAVPALRHLLRITSHNPRSKQAAGGVRIAAWQAVTELLQQDVLVQQLAPWCWELLQQCLKSLRSSGSGEPTYRVAAVHAACATALACRRASILTRQNKLERDHEASMTASTAPVWLLPMAMEDKAIYEALRVVKQAAADKFPEVRAAAARLAQQVAPLAVLTGRDVPPLQAVEDLVNTALKNIDDASPETALQWAHAAACGQSTLIAHHTQKRDENSGGGPDADGTGGSEDLAPASRFGTRKAPSLAQTCVSLKAAVQFWVDLFVKVGGELAASRQGGSFSTGGRAVRVGIGLALTHLLRLHKAAGGDNEDVSNTLKLLLQMVGSDMEQQWVAAGAGGAADATPATSGPALFGSVSRMTAAVANKSPADPSLVRFIMGRVIREGLSEMAPEPVQVTLFQELMELLPQPKDTDEKPSDGSSSPKAAAKKRASETATTGSVANAHQLQVVLVELSHLFVTLGEATASKVNDLLSRLYLCLSHESLGVRHEAALACAALTACFPYEGREHLLAKALDDIQYHHSQIIEWASAKASGEGDQSGPLGMFRRGSKQKQNKQADASVPHQQAIHGQSLMVSILVRDLPHLPGGLPSGMLGTVLSVAEILTACQFDDLLTAATAGGTCMCVRSGFCLMSGILKTGPEAVASHIDPIFAAWQKTCSSAKTGGKNLVPRHDLFCLDSALSSIVAFLKYCSQLLLSVPDALSKTTVLLEDVLQLFMPKGRIGSIPLTPPVVARLETATASLMEAFAFLPSGSFPMAADELFTFAARYIRDSVETEITCSILHSLVNREDSLLDARTFCRADSDGQVGGMKVLEDTIISIRMEAAHHSERESMLHLRDDAPLHILSEDDDNFRDSAILECYASDNRDEKPPTPLHEVGTWRKPIDPSSSAKVRLVDAAIQAFAATFGLKSGHDQQAAMDMLESLVPPLLTQLARSIGVTSSLIEQDRRPKAKEDNAVVINITAVLLSCLKSLPLHEATHNVPIALGPPWMNKAKDLLLTLIPSASNVVRRAAAEGLALLATLGVSEDAHFLQSTVLHSLDEVMQGNKPDGRPRAIALEPVSAARAGSLLTLACIQRTAAQVAKKQLERARGRSEQVSPTADDELPLLQMMTRILPSATCHGFKDYFIVRTYALHSFAVLLAYSGRLDKDALNEDDLQLIRKGVELVEDNFAASWTAASLDIDRGQEAEKMTGEIAFLAVLLRLMSFLVPSLHHLSSEDSGIARRFSLLATIMLECQGSHSVVLMEAMAFFEVLSSHQRLLPLQSKYVEYAENPLLSCTPFILESLTPENPDMLGRDMGSGMQYSSTGGVRCAAYVVKALTLSHVPMVDLTNVEVVSLLLASLEATSGAQTFAGGNMFRPLAAPRTSEVLFGEDVALMFELSSVLPLLLQLEQSFEKDSDRYLRWILLARSLLANVSTVPDADDTSGSPEYNRSGVVRSALVRTSLDAKPVFDTANPVRWQVRCVAAQLATDAIDELSNYCRTKAGSTVGNSHFDLIVARRASQRLCREASEKAGALPESRLIFHLDDLLSAACTSSVATIDQAELCTLQASSMKFLDRLIVCFARTRDPDQPRESILEQSATQILSAVRHALVSPEENRSESSLRLFLAGCEALQSVILNELTTDLSVLKRIVRPVVLPEEQVTFFPYSDGSPLVHLAAGANKVDGNKQVSLLPRIGKIWTIGKLSLLGVSDEVTGDTDMDIAVHSAATAIDGARLLLGSRVSLVGKALPEEDARSAMVCQRGFLFTSADDVEETVKAVLATAWSSCACFAVGPLLGGMASEDNDEAKRLACSDWLDAVIPLLFAGVHDVLSLSSNDDNASALSWASGFDGTEIGVDCLRGIVTLVKEAPVSTFESKWSKDVESVASLCLSSVFMPILQSSPSERAESRNKSLDPLVVEQACCLFYELAASKPKVTAMDSSFLVCLLTPLDLLQTGNPDLGDELVEKIISTCLTAASAIISKESGSSLLVEAMLQLVLKRLLVREALFPESVQDAAKQLFETCLEHESVSLGQQRRIACDLATEGNWVPWTVLSKIDNGAALSTSFPIIQERLRDFDSSHSQLEALAAVSEVAQSAPVGNSLVDRIFAGVGEDVLATLYRFGTNNIPEAARFHNQTACASSLKLSLLAYQHLSHRGSEEQEVATFLSVLLSTLVAVIRFNGLPNHPTPNEQGDQSLGRLGAQAILGVARTTPVAFKTTMSRLADHDRGLVEFAVRSEISDYAAEGQQPTKKKLNISKFQK